MPLIWYIWLPNNLYISQPQKVLYLFLFLDQFQRRCSYQFVLIKKVLIYLKSASKSSIIFFWDSPEIYFFAGAFPKVKRNLWKLHAFFMSNARLKLAKNQANAKQKVIIVHPRYHLKMTARIVKNKPRPRHRHNHTEYKTCLSIMMVICIKQHLRNIWSSIHEKVKQHWGWVEKSVAYKN